ncbi:MAG: sugar phosphate isomerase/epimerase and 4-hydroxyphenylpyruvate domain-containing protein [Devosia sp.]|uniref:bifunctional sugar phosphate isomerase/epimerase/4-hydroxyphenylpyruvate dioxygenase family protein n=1 Tax=Devosia sp. TaxID=1871048 RepID=UPI0024C715E6|nr:sugar phosphate isomerase/epimerase and 4-hydroxyphenylpyruvate domain-containing protein [Devosia sp.]UYO00281.1 MAG: sugar phosphate isomerase/epimerase and 4-hydroxyphenylpyruvate domain-containing protein [Devosia sp.]
MKTSIATVSISGDLPGKLSAIAKAGFAGVEIFENDFLVYDATPRDVGQMVRDAGLELSLFQPFRDFEGLPEPYRSRAFDRARRKFDVMHEMGAELMLVCSSVSPLALGGVDRIAADFAELGALASERGLRVGYEALAWGRHINDHRDAWEVVRRAGHESVGLILDSFHTLSRGIDPDTIRAIPKDRIFFVQLADAPRLQMDLLSWSRHHRMMPGEGDLPVEAFMRAVAATGYDGTVSLEIFNDQFRGASNLAIARDGHRSLINLLDTVRRSEPGISISGLPDIPPLPQTGGLAFIEFAADEENARSLEQVLRHLGFRKTGQHRNKAVRRYTQGEINIVVNCEREGMAHSAFVLRGLTAYAIGVSVDDAGLALERARAMDASLFEQIPPPGDAAVPAIRGVGGGIVYFLDQSRGLGDIWETEFVTTEDDTAATGLIAIDHIAQTVPHDELLSWLLYYQSILPTRKLPPVDIIDPQGLVRSQVVETSRGDIRITLNGTEDRTTVAGQFLSEAFGPGIQHIAFSTADIFATAAQLATNGLEPLPISRNYYEDIETRFGLSPDFIARLRQHNIMYDVDAEGEFLQIYTRPLGEGLFFEIVERRSGYAGYGGPNAIFRIAAQRRYLRPASVPRS